MANRRARTEQMRRQPSFDDERVYEEILRRDRSLVKYAMDSFTSAADAQKAASSLEAGKMSSALGFAGSGLEEDLRGSLSAGTARTLADREASEKARILGELQGPERLAPAHEEAERKLSQIMEDIEKQQTAGAATSTAAGAVGGTLSAIGTGLSATGPGAVVGAPLAALGAIISALGGAAGAGISGSANSPARRRAMSNIRGDAADFKAPSLRGYEKMLGSAGSGYGGYETTFTGGQAAGRRQKYGEESESDKQTFGGSMSSYPYFG